MKISRSWLQKYFEDTLPAAHELAELFTFHTFEIDSVEEVGTDHVLDVDVLPNRSSDCLSHRGVARELATIKGCMLQEDPLRTPLPAFPDSERVSVTIDTHADCPRYVAAHIRNVSVGPSPEWLVAALSSIGQRSVNNVVDILNYVMFDIGEPMHAFDMSKLEAVEGNVGLRVRRAEQGEACTVLTGEQYTLTDDDLVLADKNNNSAVLGIAGIKGGKHAEITNKTTDIVLEAAHFNYAQTRRTSRQLKLTTDASLRFQNEPSPLLAGFAMRDAVRLVEEVCGGELVGVVDTSVEHTPHGPIEVSLSTINELLGTSLTVTEVEKIFVRFEFEFSRHDDVFVVTPPWERTDLNKAHDVIEEVGRISGYGNITSVVPEPGNSVVSVNKRYCLSELIRRTLVERGYSEVYTYTLRDKGEIELTNPLAADKSFLRNNLRDGMSEALAKNAYAAPLVGLDTVKLFTVDTVFTASREYTAVALGVRAVTGKQRKAEVMLAEDVKELEVVLGHPLAGTFEGGVHEADVDVLLLHTTPPEIYGQPLPWNPTVRYEHYSQYPFVLRDIALWVPQGTKAEEPLAVIIHEASELLVRHDQFDEFGKEGRVSYAWHLVWQAPDRTLTDDEVSGEMERLTNALKNQEDWEVR